MGVVLSFTDKVVNDNVTTFIELYHRLGKAEAGKFLKTVPAKYRSEIIMKIKERLYEVSS